MAHNSNFHDPTFSSTLQDTLNQYRKEKNLTDVELRIGDKLFPAHRNVLSVGSPVLGAMISDQWLTTKVCSISDEYVDPEIMEDILSFLYTGSIHLTPDNAHPVCMAAHFLQIPNLLKYSVEYLSKLITVENVLTLLVFSIRHCLEVLRKSCLKFISIKYEKVFQDPQTLQFSPKNFTYLVVELKNQCFGTSFPEQLFHCVARWTEFSLPDRSEAFPVLLENIPLEEVSYRFLTQTVFTHPLVKESFPCIQNILGTLKFSSFETLLEQNPSSQDMIVVGGRKSDDEYSSMMNYYHSDSQTWRRLPDMLQKRKNFAVTVNNQRDIIVGGYVKVYGQTQRTGSVEMFCWETHTWRNLAQIPLPMRNHSMAVHNGQLYLVGRMQSPKFTAVWRYLFQEQKWNCVRTMNGARFDGCLISYKDHLYIINGYTRAFERFDSTSNKWTLMTSMKAVTTSVRATVHMDKIYASGMGVFEVYDPETDGWTSLTALSISEGATRLTSLVSLNGKLLAVCEHIVPGWVNSRSIHEFDFSNMQWKLFADIPLNIFPHHAVVGIGNY